MVVGLAVERFGDDFGGAATIWAYILVALVAADGALRAEAATCWARSGIEDAGADILELFSNCQVEQELREGEREATVEPALRPSTSETKVGKSGTTSAKL